MARRVIRSPIIRFGLRLWAVLLLVVTPFGALGAYLELRQAMDSANWPKTEGFVRESEVREMHVPNTRYDPHVLFGYTANGRDYTSTRLRYSNARSGKRADAQATVDQFPIGKSVTVFYDPNYPANATLEPGVTWRSYAYLALPLALIAFGVLSWRAASLKPEPSNVDRQPGEV